MAGRTCNTHILSKPRRLRRVLLGRVLRGLLNRMVSGRREAIRPFIILLDERFSLPGGLTIFDMTAEARQRFA